MQSGHGISGDRALGFGQVITLVDSNGNALSIPTIESTFLSKVSYVGPWSLVTGADVAAFDPHSSP